MHDAVRMCGNKLLIDIHDEYRPTGFASQVAKKELGNEGADDANNTILTRFIAGAADYTICYYIV